ncbi:uncharacterized protein [Procambarus clarkii]|uniref:uncharacterized protein n=1 Tax=Procambarus clarkii TaxID=6728 RepID=UPI003741FDCD
MRMGRQVVRGSLARLWSGSSSGQVVMPVILVWLWCWFSATQLATPATHGYFFKVTYPTFPNLSACTIGSRPVSGKFTCAALCLQDPKCSLFCLSGGACQLYSAKVGRNWAGQGTFMAGTCFSNWGSTIMNNVSVTAHNEYSAYYAAAFGIDGFFCSSIHECFSSFCVNQSYFALSLGSYRAVTSVKIQTLGYYFSNVKIRVGNSSSYSTGFSANTLLATFIGPVTANTVLTFTATQPIVGSVVSFMQNIVDCFCMCDIQVFAQ